ncbi:hypothetical protein PPYR_04601 [Photinus pyralis]|uniref:Uncharacterized protein n=1 Tax=Photinus pyralis TaxID=7054 RepID=A0A1Y1LSL1_PHOPY|nr:neuropeptide CCHamide-2-like [Photinus pyralis]KAB0802415.1 hypothetical protein PPYR_04601 [Photinus pyralis]
MYCTNGSFVAFFAMAALILVIKTDAVDAKRGCATFGHSCYGGMGKRMSPSELMTNDEVLQDVQQESNPGLIFTGPRGDIGSDTERRISLQELYNISPFFRQWLQSYRRSQEMHNNGNN